MALNATPGMSRDQLCRLAGRPDLLEPRMDAEAETAGIRTSTLELARRLRSRSAKLAAAERARAEASGIRILHRFEAAFPGALLDLELPPPVLYCSGALPDAPAIAIVGPRVADAYGLEVARSFGLDLAEAGVLVVSGFAQGIDATAHRAALEARNGRTAAVLGCGLDVDYPRGQRRLKVEIAARGAVLSEFPLGTEPRAAHFPVRNRIIAALAWATVVVQARRRSGSLITARLALELGREVLAVPGRIFDPRAEGTNLLLRDGAHPALDAQDIIETLPGALRERLRSCTPAPSSSEGTPLLESGPGLETDLLARLGSEPRGAEALARELALPIAPVLAALGALELDGRVRRHAGGVFAAAPSHRRGGAG